MIYLYPTAKLKPKKSATVTSQSLGGSSGKWDDVILIFGLAVWNITFMRGLHMRASYVSVEMFNPL